MKFLSGSVPDWIKTFKGKGIKSELARNSAGTLVLKISETLFSFLVAVLLARALGVDGYGSYSYVYALVSIFAIPAQFGLPNLIVRETAKALASQEWGVIKGVWRWASQLTGILATLLILGSGIVIVIWGDQFNQEQLLIFYWGLGLMPLIALSQLRGAALRGLHRIIEGQIPEQAIFPGLFLAFILLMPFILPDGSLTPVSAMALQVLAAALAFISGAWLLWRATPPKVRASQAVIEGRTWLASTLPLAFISGMQVINRRVSIIMLGIFLNSSDVGIFRVADQMAFLISIGLQAINLVVAPQFARLHAMGDKTRLQKLATGSSRVIFFLTLIIVAAFMAAGKPFLAIVFGAEYIPAYIPLCILAIGQLVNAASGSVAILLNMTGHEKETARGLAIAAIGNAVLNLALIPIWGITGAAIASAVALSAWNIVLLVAVRRKLKINSMAFGFDIKD